MTKRMLIDASHPEETRVVIADGTRVEELDFESRAKRQLRGNVYLARVTRVEPSLQAAFVEYGGNRHGFLAFSEIHPDYYQIPYEDRVALLEAEEEEAIALAEEDDADSNDDSEADASDDETKTSDKDDKETVSEGEDDPSEDQEVTAKKRRYKSNRRRYKIQEVIKRGQILLIQVVKEERGNKGAAMTTYLSLAGRYCVLMPNTPRGGGISRKIANGSDRKRLKTIVADLKVPKGIGVIVRTAGAKRTKPEIKRDYEYLSRLWETIRDKTLKSIAPSLIHEEGDLVKRSIRDLYNKDISEILVQGDDAYKDAKTFIKMLMPSHSKNVKAYKENIPLFLRYDIERQLENSLDSLVQLKSGGYLVIHPTEALVSIDVNSGRSTKERNVERTALKTNLEAVDEVARQMRLRDLAGLVVIDFIDMDDYKNNRAVQSRMKDALSKDRARVQAGRISQFGLMEISRQRRRRSLLDASTTSCPHCQGVGRQRTTESSALRALRSAAETGVRGRASRIRLRVTPDVALYMINEKRAQLDEIQATYDMFTELYADDSLLKPDFGIDVLESRTSENGDPLIEIEKQNKKERQEQDRKASKPRSKKTDESKATAQNDDTNEHRGEEKAEQDDDQPKRRRRRGRRGGRRRKGESNENSENASQTEKSPETVETGANDTVAKDDAKAETETSKPKRSRAGRRKAPGRKVEDSTDVSNDQTVDAPAKDETKKPKTKAKTSKAATAKTGRSTSRRPAPKRADVVETDETKEAPKAKSTRKAPAKKAPKAKAVTKKAPAKSSTAARRKAPTRKAPELKEEAVTNTPAPKKAAPKKAAPKKAAPKKAASKKSAPKAKTTGKAATKKAPAKKAAPKKAAPKKAVKPTEKPATSPEEAATKPRTRKAPARKMAETDAPKTLSAETTDNVASKKTKKRSWLKRLTGEKD
ncbi:MAG: Rne/Rng family ribonuclease [Maricaulaceae bacterium]